jgi:acyl-coenzyme A thioesterase PaaI-like protein
MSVGEDLRAIADLLAEREIDAATSDALEAALGAARVALEAAPLADRAALPPGAHHDRVGPLRGFENVVAPPLVFGEPATRDGMLVVNAVARCGARYEGPPGLVHGGIVAACFDEMLAVAQRDAGVGGVTRSLEVRYRRPIRVGEALVFTAGVEHDDGRRALVRGACHVDGELCADATAEFSRPR